MAEREKSSELVAPQELAVSSAYEIAAIVAVLEQKGILTQAEVLDQVKRLKAMRATVR